MEVFVFGAYLHPNLIFQVSLVIHLKEKRGVREKKRREKKGEKSEIRKKRERKENREGNERE